VREEQARHLTLAWPLLRQAVDRLRRLAGDDGVAIASDEIYFFTMSELLERASPEAARERRGKWERERRLSAPVRVGTMGLLQRRVFGDADASPSQSAALLRGSPASPGRATGPARVVLGAESFDALLAGEILIAPATNPGWTPLFSRAAAVVTDTGSLMAHASLVAREYGIPAVVGTGDATRVLHDGDLVLVDGNTGVVERLS
jgi:pyruvate,water dikinase